MFRIAYIVFIGLLFFLAASSQTNDYWQQKADYKIYIDVDVEKHRFHAESDELVYHNNSPDTLYKIYFHLYYNAFKPNSMMSVRSANIPDPERQNDEKIVQN